MKNREWLTDRHALPNRIGTFDGDGDPAEPGGEQGDGDSPKIDLTHPAVKAAVTAAVEAERRQAKEREAGLVANRDQILKEKKRFQEVVGDDPDAVKERLERLRKLETEQAAERAGTSTEEFEREVERVASEKFAHFEAQQAKLAKAKDQKIEELEKSLRETQQLSHRRFVEAHLYRANIPEDTRIFHDGAEDHLISALMPVIAEHQIDGLPNPIPAVQINESIMPGSSGTGKPMELRELLEELRQPGTENTLGRNLSYCFISNASGSGSRTPNQQAAPTGGNWSKMSETQRSEYIEKHGVQAAKTLIDQSIQSTAAN